MSAILLCKWCFYQYRAGTSNQPSCFHHVSDKLPVYWNEDLGFYETTKVRDPPKNWAERWRRFTVVRMCDPFRGTCRKDDCIYAHGLNEQRKWNYILHSRENHTFTGINAATKSTPNFNQQLLSPQVVPQHQATPTICTPQFSSTQAFLPTPYSEKFECRVQKTLELEQIQLKLTKNCYVDKFYNLICWEEKCHIEELGEKCNSVCQIHLFPNHSPPHWIKSVNKQHTRFGCIKGLSQDQIAYSTQASEAVFAVSDSHEVKLKILAENFHHCDDDLYIAFDERDEQLLSLICSQSIRSSDMNIGNVRIEFEVKHSYFNSLIRAVNSLRPEIIERLLPTEQNFRPFSQSYSFRLSQSLGLNQLECLAKILTCDSASPPFLINGSFGTGKTRLLAVASHCLIQHGQLNREPIRILICAHHPATVDVMVQNYFGPILQRDPNLFELISLISQNKWAQKSCHQYGKYYKPITELPHGFECCPFIIVATSYSSSSSLQRRLGDNFFTHILLDEGSQVREPEAITSLALASPSTKIVIAGDSRQVGPALLVLGEEARENGLKYSIQERLESLYMSKDLAETAASHIFHLNVNYRCHGEIMKILNNLFYKKEIISNPVNAKCHPKAPYPLLFVCSSLSSGPVSSPMESQKEAHIVLDFLQELVIENWPKAEWGDKNLSDVSVIAASRTQVVCITNIAKHEYHNDTRYIAKFPSYAIQGREFQALFISTIEPLDASGRSTNPTKSLCDKYVFNTVLSRTKSLVVAVGNPYALLKTEEKMGDYGCWKTYISHCIDNKTFYIPQTVEPVKRKREHYFESLRVLVGKSMHVKSQQVEYKKCVSSNPPNSSLTLKPPKDTNILVSGSPETIHHQRKLSSQKMTGVPSPEKTYPTDPSPSSQEYPMLGGNTRPSKKASFNNGMVVTTPKTAFAVRSTKETSALPKSSSLQQKLKELKTVSGSSEIMYHQRKLSSQEITGAPSPEQMYPTEHLSPSSQEYPMLGGNTQQSKKASFNNAMVETKPKTAFALRSTKETSTLKSTYHQQKLKEQKTGYRPDEDNFPTLENASKISKRAVQNLKAQDYKRTLNVNCSKHSNGCLKYKDQLDSNISILESDLTPENYIKKFHYLLCLEELEHNKQLSEMCDGEYEIHIYKEKFPEGYGNFARYGYITSDSGDVLGHIKQASQGAFIILDFNKIMHVEFVSGFEIPNKANFNALTIEISKNDCDILEQFTKEIPQKRFKSDFCIRRHVKFELKHFYFQNLHNAIDNLPAYVIQRLIPNPRLLSVEHNIPYDSLRPAYKCLHLDGMQIKGLETVFSSSPNFPILIAGPFGTGKTRMLARIAYEILKKRNSRVLICAHHQASADTFVNYFGSMIEDDRMPWRMGMVRIIPNSAYHFKDYLKYQHFFKQIKEVTENLLMSKRLVITTLGTVQKIKHVLKHKKTKFFTDILIDEGAQTREPETVGPLIFAGETTRIVIAGDHCQVGPKLLVLGESAQKYGLGRSLLERLHETYTKAIPPLQTHLVTLLTNYRSHSGILMLPSSLFYQSTLQCRVPDHTSHPNAPFPIAFVCSGLEEKFNSVPGINLSEVQVLTEEFEKYFFPWPVNWKRNESKICIMSPSANQCSELRKRFRKIRCSVDILKAYEIQGTEFKAIFISTSEPTHEDGRCKYETKSISDRYVFNTAITRSKSLVVAVGNPFFLLHLENQMVEKYGESARCWSHYIRQCIECKTFSISKKLRNDLVKPNIDKLLNMIYTTTTISAEILEPDSIIKAYKRVFEELKECRQTKVLLSSSSGGRLSWKMEDYAEIDQETGNDEVSIAMKDEYKCILDIHNRRKAKAIPLDSSKQIVKIRGLKNRRGAFNGDSVVVGVFEDSPKGKAYGKVKDVVKRGSNLKFICKVSSTNPIFFFPIDEKNPVLINLPRLSRDLLKKRDLRNDVSEDDLATKDVVVFKMPPKQDSEETENVPLPQIKRIIPLSVAKNMLFLVSFVKWDLKYRSPLGIVEGVFPKGFSHFNAERLLTFQHGIAYNENKKNTESQVVDIDASSLVGSPVFTIDPEGARNLDDAFSITKVGTEAGGKVTYKLGVHIVNAAKHIQCNEDVDIEARKLGLSVYGSKKGEVMHMLSSEELRSQLSLNPGKKRSVISVSCLVTLDPHDPSQIAIQSVSIKDDEVKSCMKLTYEIAQQILSGQVPMKYSDVSRLFNNLSFCLSMKALYDISFAMRLKRIQSDAAYAYDISEAGEENCWQTHLLVEELMIWANHEVAKKIHRSYPNAAILRCQSPPNKAKLDQLVEENESVMANSLSLSRFINSEASSNFSDVLVPVDVLHKITRALQENDLVKLAYYLFTNKCYPQLAAVESEIHSISLSAEYCCTEAIRDSYDYHHSGLCLNEYTHFSSPMRRYCDIQVQRMLLKCLNKSSTESCCPESNNEICHAVNNKICLELNTRTKNSKSFERNIKLVNFTLEFLTTSKVYSAFIIKDTGKNVTLKLPHLNLQNFPKKSLIINIPSISLSFSIVSLKLTNMAEVLSTQHLSVSSISSNSNGEINAYISETDSYLHCAKYGFIVENLGIKIQNKTWMEAMSLIKKPSVSLDSEDKANLTKIFSVQSKVVPTADLEKAGKDWLYVECEVYDPWKSPGIVKVWLSWSMKGYILSPIIQLIEISPLIRFCNQHCSHPAACFSDPNLIPASKRTYTNIDEYISLWKKVLLAEAAEKSVHERDSKPILFRDVHLNWPKLEISKECVDDLYYIPTGKVQMIISRKFAKECLAFFNVQVGCLVCVRCEDETASGIKAVFHFVIDNVDDDIKKLKDVIVHMSHVGDQNCHISHDMKTMMDSGQWKYEVQIMRMSDSYRRVFAGLVTLWNPKISSKLSQDVAVNIENHSDCINYPPRDINRCLNDKFSMSLSNWSAISSKKSIPLNQWQKESIHLALKNPFQLIQGPPGTGKSVTGAHIAYILALLNKSVNRSDNHNCVFYCGPSNKSVDVVLEKFSQLLEVNSHLKKDLRILRIYSSSVERKYYSNPTNKPQVSVAECPQWAQKFALHSLLRDASNCSKVPELKQLKELEESIDKIKSEGKIPSGLKIRKHKEILDEATKAFLEKNKFDIVFCTCNESSGKRAKLFSVRQCIIDESGMAYEPETIVPLRLCEHAVLIGDHQQLQPVIDYGPAKQCGLSRSLFERYAVEYEKKYTYTLKIQYRMHEEICGFPSKYFYDDMLETDDSVKSRTNPETRIQGFWPQGSNKPIVFINNIGEENVRHRGSNEYAKAGMESKSNTLEARKALDIARCLHAKHGVAVSELAVLTPYTAQREKIKMIIKENYKDLENLLVASINESQGNEFGIVILSTVRSQPLSKIKNKHIVQPDHIWMRENLGFITDKHQINVGITRSKYGLIIIGNQKLLSYDHTWNELLKYYEQKKCIVEGSRFPPS